MRHPQRYQNKEAFMELYEILDALSEISEILITVSDLSPSNREPLLETIKRIRLSLQRGMTPCEKSGFQCGTNGCGRPDCEICKGKRNGMR